MRDVIALENVEPKKKKGTLAKIADRGGRFGKSSESRDITPTKNFIFFFSNCNLKTNLKYSISTKNATLS